ncbi:hypothetical protein DYB32_003305 [Aphanomyces invadans]|uniref:Uncharacterized protein n=1 Tax=Aphanomyces invadans TaxID=157072 RepID=A0A3R6VZS8_9STRA|nr:hypothetical protein DYB32_003305 [Aphanomyces invadans]
MFSLIHTMNKGDLTAAAGEYVNLYKRLIYGTSCIYGEKAVLDQHIDDLIERDSGGHLSMDKTRLCVSIYELAETWAKGEVVQTYVDFLTGLLHSELQTLTSRAELHEYVFVLYKDELLVQRKRSKKTEVLSKANSTIKPQTPDPERIEVCQRQLQTIGHIAEIAWLRCSLQNYLDNAEKGRVDDLTLLVEDVEHGVQTFVDAITEVAMATATTTTSTNAIPKSGRLRKAQPQRRPRHELCFGKHQVTYDLPSMKTYVQKVAPSYAAYTKPKSNG